MGESDLDLRENVLAIQGGEAGLAVSYFEEWRNAESSYWPRTEMIKIN